jgi:flavin reductase (DIM6/NTAB) family NADH-FMN oxidoreductase RutF
MNQATYKTFQASEISELERFFRTNLINSFCGVKQVFLLGSTGSKYPENLAPFTQVMHLGANPAAIGILFRPDSVERHSLENIRKTKYFSLNTVPYSMAELAHHTAARWQESEFKACGFETEYLKDYLCPMVKISSVKGIFKMMDEIKLFNETILLTASYEQVIVSESALSADGFINHSHTESLAAIGLDAYTQATEVTRFSYPKPETPPTRIS